MQRTTVAIIALAGGLALATAAGAQGRGGGGGHGGGMGSGMGSAMSSSMRSGAGSSDFGVTTRDASRVNSEGAAHASATAHEHANANSEVATGTTVGNLTGLATGMTVKDKAGMTLGTVSRIERSHNGTIRSVIVAGATGERHTIRLAPDTLAISGGVVTTTKAIPKHTG